MKILLKEATIYDTQSVHHLDQMDLLIEDGIILKVAKGIEAPYAQVIKSDHLCISPGWLDVGTFNGEPGYEQREDLNSLKEAGAHGGYVFLAPQPNTQPAVDSKAQINFLQRQNDFYPTEILPLATATVGAKGQDMSEMVDLLHAGAVAFTDGSASQLSKGHVLRTLEYLKGVGGLYIHYLPKNNLALNGQINEGIMSIQLGLEGSPIIEEIINLQEVLTIASYADTKMSIHNISTAKSIKLINKSDSDIYPSVPYLNLIKDENHLADFNVNLKVWPPLRTEKDRKELALAIEKGDINCINSNHMPVLQEDKDREFGLAKFGAVGLETCFAGVKTLAKAISIERLVFCLSEGPYEFLDLDAPTIKEGAKSVLTLFDPTISISITPEFLKSKSKNNPFIGSQLEGKVIGIINGLKSSFF
jgi:dihydroorotase